VIATFDQLLGQRVEGRVTEAVVGANGVAIRLHVDWPNPGEGREIDFFQAYLVSDGLVTEIQHHHDRGPAVAAISN
jgi:hypothetical protein